MTHTAGSVHPTPHPLLPISPLLFLFLFFIFLLTLHPAFQLDDSPETVAASANLSVQHAPGYPAITLLGRLFAALPAGGITFRVNLLAAVLGAGCALVCAALIRSLAPARPGVAVPLAAAWFATTRIVWECALSAKGAIYLFNLLMLGLATRALVAGGRRGVLMAAAFAGTALGAHWMTAIWWLPVIAVAGRPWMGRRAGLGLWLLAAGASLTLVLPLCATREPSWGDAGSLAGLTEILLRRTFLPQAALKPGWLTGVQLGDGLFAPLREGGGVWLLLGVAGWVFIRRRAAATILLAGPLLALGAVAALANPVHLPSGTLILWLTDRFHLPWLLAAGAGAGVALARLEIAVPDRRGVILGATAVLAGAGAVSRLPQLAHGADYLGWDFAENLRAHVRTAAGRATAPVTVLAEADYQSFPLLVPLHATGGLPGARLIVTNPFLDRPGGWRRLARTLPEATGLETAGGPLTGAPDDAATARVLVLAERLGARGPVLHLPMCSYPGLRARLVPAGLLHEVREAPPAGAAPAPRVARVRIPAMARLRWRGITADRPSRDAAAWSVLDVYGLTRAGASGEAFRAGRLEDVVGICERALPFAGGFGRAYLLTTLGHAQARLERYAQAEASFRGAARIRPRDPDLWTNVATACAAQGRTGDALALFDRILRRHPGHAGALANLRTLRERLTHGLPARR